MPNAAPVFRTCVKSSRPGNDRDALVQRQRGPHDGFRQLVENHDDKRQPDFEPPPFDAFEAGRLRGAGVQDLSH